MNKLARFARSLIMEIWDIYIASCRVVVKFYKDLYLDIVTRIVAAWIKLISIFKFYPGKTTPETDKAVKVSATAEVKWA